MTTLEIAIPVFFLGLAGVGILFARHSAHRLEKQRETRHPAE